MGVFDPGVNALSILTALIPDCIKLTNATLAVPANYQAPLTAELSMHTSANAPITASFDFLQTGLQTWDILVHTASGALTLTNGGAKLTIAGEKLALSTEPNQEYAGVYRHFAQCVRTGESDCDLRPLELVADAFLLGRRETIPAFSF
jgi:D-galactose 1-dehydrogenase